MHRKILTALAALALCAAVLPAAAAGTPAADTSVSPAIQGQALFPAGTPPSSPQEGTATPADSSPPAGPVDPGTGETRQSKETRIDYAPYVIAAVLLVVLIGAWFLWRHRRNKTIV